MTIKCPATPPGHTFVVAIKHELVSSLYVTREITEASLTYSGVTHASIRSFKHDKANVFSCVEDFKYVIGDYGTNEWYVY